MRKNNTLKERLSISIDDTSKVQIGLEAKKAGVPLSEYVRFILEDRAKILNPDKATENRVGQETLDRLQRENKRLQMLIENASASIVSEEQIEQMDALQSENEALRADMELLRVEVEDSEENDLVSSIKEKLLTAETRVEEVEEKYAVSQEVHETEKEALIAEHKKVKQELIDEINELSWSEISDEEAELIAQHEKEFNGIVAKLNKEEASSAEKNLIIEELEKKVSDYENNQLELTNAETEKLVSAEAKIAELEEQLNTFLYEKEGERGILASTEHELEKTKAQLSELYEERTVAKKSILEATGIADELREQLRQFEFEKEQSEFSQKSQNKIITELKTDLEKVTLQSRQLLTEQQIAADGKELLLEEIERLKKQEEYWENMANGFADNAKVALNKLEEEMTSLNEMQSQCSEQEGLIGKLKKKLKQFIDRINVLEDELRVLHTESKPDAYAALQISEFTEEEIKLYNECLVFLRTKHQDISNNNLLIASLYNSCKNKQSILITTPYSTSLKAVVKNFRA